MPGNSAQYVPVAYRTGITAGTTITSSSASQNIAVPVDATGNNPKRIIVQASTTNGVHVKLCFSSGTSATTSDLLIGSVPIVLDATGCGFVAIVQETSAAKVNICPVEQ